MSKRVLIAYYTHSGNTERVAQMITERSNGDLFLVQPETPYPASYNAVVEQAKQEIKKNFMPSIKPCGLDLSDYDTILIGTPNWWSTLAPPIAAFLFQNDLSGKAVGVFCTHGGGGSGNIESAVRKLCPDSKMLSILSLYGDGGGKAKKSVAEWVAEIE